MAAVFDHIVLEYLCKYASKPKESWSTAICMKHFIELLKQGFNLIYHGNVHVSLQYKHLLSLTALKSGAICDCLIKQAPVLLNLPLYLNSLHIFGWRADQRLKDILSKGELIEVVLSHCKDRISHSVYLKQGHGPLADISGYIDRVNCTSFIWLLHSCGISKGIAF